MITLGGINYRTNLAMEFNDDILIDGNIDGQSTVHFKLTNGNIIVNGKIDGQSTVTLEAPNGFIHINEKLDGQCTIILKAGKGISIGGKVDGQCKVKLFSKEGQIVVNEKIDGGSRTIVYHHGVNKIDALGGIRGGAVFMPRDWEAEDIAAESARLRELEGEAV